MDNDKQVKNHINIFLKDELLENLNQQPELYNLEQEFSKTRHNKNIKLWKITGISLGAILLFVIISSFVVQIQKNNIKIDINDFEDTNLMDLLSNNGKVQKQYDELKIQINDLEAELKNKITELKDKAEKDIDLINTKRLSEDIKKSQINNINRIMQNRIYLMKSKYNRNINAKKIEMKNMERNLGVIDKKKIEEARKKVNSINNQDALTNIEIDKIKNSYELKIQDLMKRYNAEISRTTNYYKNLTDTVNQNNKEDINSVILKYNPNFTDQNILNIINADQTNDINIDNIGNDEINKLINDRNILIKKLLDIEYSNSVPKTIKTVDYLDKKIIDYFSKEKK